nr:hypothetical protein - dog [Canis lupus familiaris]
MGENTITAAHYHADSTRGQRAAPASAHQLLLPFPCLFPPPSHRELFHSANASKPSNPTQQGLVGNYSHVDCLDCLGKALVLCQTVTGHGKAGTWRSGDNNPLTPQLKSTCP